MSTPTKFSLGGVPRTKTGLIPASYTQMADKLSMSNHYQELPTKPKPEKYKYRGDFVNERNKKLLHERRLAEKQRRTQYLLDSSNETDSLLVSPRSRSLNNTSSTESSNELLSSDQEKEMKWDSYCQHISCHRLTNDEALAKSENKKHFVSFLRSDEAKKKREKSPKKDKEPEPVVVQKKKKPPVPRLSKLARSSSKKGKENNKNETNPSQPAPNGNPKESDNKIITSTTTTTKLRYLDFISEKQTGEESPSSPAVKVNEPLVPEAVNSDKDNVDNDDTSKFRTQIERIVERAAQMVLKDNTSSTSLDESTADDANDTINSSPSIDENKKQPNEAITDTDESSSQFQSQKQRLELLEEQVRSMSSSTTDSLVFSSSTIDQDMKKRYSSGQRDGSISCTSSVTEVLPRSHVQPMSASLVWQQCFGSSSSSYTGSGYLTELDSSSTFLDSRASESKQYTQSNESQEDIDDHSSCIRSTNETVTEVEPRLLSVKPSIPLERIQPSLETCPEETTALPHINPSAEPSRECSEDPEPVPRGYAHIQDDCGRDTFDIDIDDIMPRSAVNKGRSETLVDDLFSLL